MVIILLILGGIIAGVPLFLYFLLDNDPAHFFSLEGDHVLEWLPYSIPFLGGVIIFLVAFFVSMSLNKNKKDIQKLWQTGKEEEARVISNTQNFHYRINDVPQRVVVFETLQGKKICQFKFFGEQVAELLPMGTTLTICHNSEDQAVPTPSFFSNFIR